MNQLQQEILNSLMLFQPAPGNTEGLPNGIKAPIFSLTDSSGNIVTLDDFSGQTVLVIFSNTSCSACQHMYSVFRSYEIKYPRQVILMISNGTKEENQKLLLSQGFEFTVLNWQDKVAEAYKVPGTPFFYVIDAEGKVLNKGFAGSLQEMENLLQTTNK